MSAIGFAFDRIVRRDKYASYDEFLLLFKEFQRVSGSCYAIAGSCSRTNWAKRSGPVIPESFPFKYVRFRCVHAARKRLVKCARLPNEHCQSAVGVREKDGFLWLRNVKLLHNHDLRPRNSQSYPANRRLTEEQERNVLGLMKTFKRTSEVLDYIRNAYKISLTHDDLRRLRDRGRRNANERSTLSGIRDLLDGSGPMAVLHDGANRLRLLAFTTNELMDLFLRFGEVVLVDSTYGCNRGSYHLWHVCIVDCTGRGRSVFYAFIPNETDESYDLAVGKFCELMTGVAGIMTVILDKSRPQLNAVKRHLPNARILYCQFHVLKNIRERVSVLRETAPEVRANLRKCIRGLVYSHTKADFRMFLSCIGSCSSELHEYITKNWLPEVSAWSMYGRLDACTFGNNTNNRIESANRYLKTHLNMSSSLLDCVEAIQNRNDQQRSTYSRLVGLSMIRCERDEAIGPWGSRLTAFAVKLIADNCKRKCQVLTAESAVIWFTDQHVVTQFDGQQCDCSFYSRWLLPCHHMCEASRLDLLDLTKWVDVSRWKLPVPVAEVPVVSTCEVAAVTSFGSKFRQCKESTMDLMESLMRTGNSNLPHVLQMVRDVTDKVNKGIYTTATKKDLSSSHANQEDTTPETVQEEEPIDDSSSKSNKSTEWTSVKDGHLAAILRNFRPLAPNPKKLEPAATYQPIPGPSRPAQSVDMDDCEDTELDKIVVRTIKTRTSSCINISYMNQ